MVRLLSMTPHAPPSVASRPFRRLLAVILVALAVAGCHARGPEKAVPAPRLVLLFAPCTVQAGQLSPYGGPPITPSLDAFAAEARVFERHVTESGQSGTAYASIFTGVQAPHHGVFHHPTRLADGPEKKLETIGETFSRGGFRVEAWLAHVMASGELGYGRGAHEVRETALVPDDPDFLALLAELRDDPGARTLVISHLTLTHSPYRFESLGVFCRRHPARCSLRDEDPERFDAAVAFYLNHHGELARDFPDVAARFDLEGEKLDYLARVIRILYRANVARLDDHFGRLLHAIDEHGLLDESLVVFTADHGETLYHPGRLFHWTHGHQLAPEVLRVPLLVRGPGIEPGRWNGVTRSVDVLPTLAALAGLDGPDLPEDGGVDLSPWLVGDDPAREPPRLTAWSHTTLLPEVAERSAASWELFRRYYPRNDPRRMWVQARTDDVAHQIRRDPRGEPVAITVDAATGEEIGVPPAVWLERLRDYHRRLVEGYGRHGGSAVDDARQEELLRSLGYIE